MDAENTSPRRIRVLHLTGGLNRAGAETWLMHVWRNIDRRRFQFDFVVNEEGAYDYEGEAKSLGAGVIRCRWPAAPWTYFQNFRRILKFSGPYDVVHSHVHHFNGLALLAARAEGVPVRIAHSHSTCGSGTGVARRIYSLAAASLIHSNATSLVGASRRACESLFGERCWRDPRLEVIRNGLDLRQLPSVKRERSATRRDLKVIHVGRFETVKNHAFLLRIFAELQKARPEAELFLIGDGVLRSEIERLIVKLNLSGRVHLPGVRQDVFALLESCDVFLFPSTYEGFGIAALEAQACGLPCLVSAALPPEIDLGLGLCEFMSLGDSPESWAGAALALLERTLPGTDQIEGALKERGYDIQEVCGRLQTLYTACYTVSRESRRTQA